MPSRLNQFSLFIKKHGIYYGQCSEICGVNHAFMPIVVEAIPAINEYTAENNNGVIYKMACKSGNCEEAPNIEINPKYRVSSRYRTVVSGDLAEACRREAAEGEAFWNHLREQFQVKKEWPSNPSTELKQKYVAFLLNRYLSDLFEVYYKIITVPKDKIFLGLDYDQRVLLARALEAERGKVLSLRSHLLNRAETLSLPDIVNIIELHMNSELKNWTVRYLLQGIANNQNSQ